MSKQFALFNIEKVGSLGELRGRWYHNTRKSRSWNVNSEKSHHNVGNGVDVYEVIKNRIKDINKQRQEAGAHKLRKTAIPAVEVVLSASHQFFKDKSDDEVLEWAQDQIEWTEERYKGKGKVVGFDLHFKDEKCPHIHLLIIPETLRKDKNTGAPLPVLSAKDLVGNQAKMRADRTSHAKAMAKWGLERGKDYYELGEEPPPYMSMAELRRKTAEAKKELEEASQNLSVLDELIIERIADLEALESEASKRKKSRNRAPVPA